MYTMTYNSLVVDIQRYLERGFTEASDPLVFDQIPRLITLAERRIATDVKLLGFQRAIQTNMQVGLSTYLKPDRWRRTTSMSFNGTPIFARSYEFCRSYWPSEATTGTPKYYSDYDYQHWFIVPTPSTAGVLEIIYDEQPALLGDDCQSNWLTEYAPNLLLYAALLEAAPFLKNDERVPLWKGLYDDNKQSFVNQDLKRVLDRSAVRESV